MIFRYTRSELTYFILLTVTFAFTVPGWRSYRIELGSEKILHTISTDDFLVYLISFTAMGMPAIIRQLFRSPQVLMNRVFFLTGFITSLFFYTMSLVFPERIAAVQEASFTVPFYIFGILLIICGILGVPGFFTKPSTHLRYSRH